MTNMEKVQTVVIGAGVIGLACARRLAEKGHEVLILERATSIGAGEIFSIFMETLFRS